MHFLFRLVTLTEILEQSLKQKSYPQEVIMASMLYSSALVNLGDDANGLSQHLVALLRTHLLNPNGNVTIKQNCSIALRFGIQITIQC